MSRPTPALLAFRVWSPDTSASTPTPCQNSPMTWMLPPCIQNRLARTALDRSESYRTATSRLGEASDPGPFCCPQRRPPHSRQTPARSRLPRFVLRITSSPYSTLSVRLVERFREPEVAVTV